MKNFIKLSKKDKLNIFNQTSVKTGLPPSAIEKDWWVTLTLKIIFSLPYSEHVVFKGGTSLSKGWNLIERFSEDIDLAISREFLGFSGELKKKQVTRLRKASCSFISTKFSKELNNELSKLELEGFEVIVQETGNSDTDPLVVELKYDSLTEELVYLKPRVLIEVGARSLMEPADNRGIKSIVSEVYSKLPFADKEVNIPVVLPKRTFLEKIFLLHEEFQKPIDKIHVYRMSRHMYDLEKLMDTAHGTEALKDAELYNMIVDHRSKFNVIRGIDYEKHKQESINIIPPEEILKDWEKDYTAMKESMFYGDTISFSELIKRIGELNARINAV